MDSYDVIRVREFVEELAKYSEEIQEGKEPIPILSRYDLRWAIPFLDGLLRPTQQLHSEDHKERIKRMMKKTIRKNN